MSGSGLQQHQNVTAQPARVSLVITTYNRAAMLITALESVADSEVRDRDRVEVIVVDNNSTDDTAEIVNALRARGFPFELRYVLEQRQGLSFARNRGVDEANGTYVAYMDDDQRLEKHFLARIESAFRDTHAVCVGGPIFYYNDRNLPAWLPALLENVGQYNLGSHAKVLGLSDEMLPGGNMVFDRRALIAIGKYDVRLGRSGGSLMAGEEDELQERLHAAGKTVAYHPSLIQYHYLAPARLTKRYWRRHMFDHGRTLYRRRPAPADTREEPSWLGAPRWMWRNLLTHELPHALHPLLSLDRVRAFHKQLDVFTCLGQIHEARQLNKAQTGT